MVYRRSPAFALSIALATGAIVGCDDVESATRARASAENLGEEVEEAPSAAARSASRAGDGPQLHTAAIDTPRGRFEFDSLLEHHVTADQDGPWVALLVREADDAWTGTFHVGRADAPEPVLDGVTRGLRGCSAQPRLWVFTRVRDGDPGRRGLWIHDGESLRERPLTDVALDRVAGLSPDCRWAVIVTREGGLPVLQAVSLTGTDAPTPLANHELSYTPGTRPAGFVPPPTHNDTLRWEGSRRFRYEAGDESIALELPARDGGGTR